MTEKDFKRMAELLIELNCEFPFDGQVIKFVEKKIKEHLLTKPKFNALKWNRYINEQISKRMVRDRVMEDKLCPTCLGQGFFEQSHDGMGRELTCWKCSGTGMKNEEEPE